jgi:hypothetical protein
VAASNDFIFFEKKVDGDAEFYGAFCPMPKFKIISGDDVLSSSVVSVGDSVKLLPDEKKREENISTTKQHELFGDGDPQRHRSLSRLYSGRFIRVERGTNMD